ncbi:hypothetical protein OF83DRAFT_442866 [Amylostereum chailletii]|nr:hypothetical protein OF83DRAFT_442866 [Amylostereum chailletii]
MRGEYRFREGFRADSEEVEDQLFDGITSRAESPICLEERGSPNGDDVSVRQDPIPEIVQQPPSPRLAIRDIATPSSIVIVPSTSFPSHEAPLSPIIPPSVTTSLESSTSSSIRNGVQRFQRKIRSTGLLHVWFSSFGNEALPHPHPVDGPVVEGNIYIHKIFASSPQIWMRTKEGLWLPVSVDAPHPLLPSHLLALLPNGDPTWLTRKTVVTYRGRAKQPSTVSRTNV